MVDKHIVKNMNNNLWWTRKNIESLSDELLKCEDPIKRLELAKKIRSNLKDLNRSSGILNSELDKVIPKIITRENEDRSY